MPTRLIDYDALWSSDKLLACKVEARREYSWLYGLADAYGCFELTNLRVIHGRVAPIREDLSLERLAEVLDEYHDHGLLFTWEQGRKRFGYWTGCEDRLPPKSLRERYARRLPPVPEKELQEYLAKFPTSTAELVKSSSRPAVDPVTAESGTTASDAQPSKAKLPKESSAEGVELAQLLRQKILQNNPKAKITEARAQRWALEADKMMRRDGRTPGEIRELIEFSQRDLFWLQNVLSMQTLREKFDQLWLKRNGSAKPGPTSVLMPKPRTELDDTGRAEYARHGISCD